MELKGKYCKDCKVFIDDVEDEALSLIYGILDTREFKDSKVRIMPDTHAGKGIVIGFTSPIQDSICPSHVGVDIGCTITTCLTDTKINSEEFELIEHRIKKEIPMGFNINSKRVFEMKDFIKFLKSEYQKSRSSWPEMINEMEISEKGITKLLQRIGMDEGMFYKSLCSLGGGNHFIEIGDWDNGKYAFTVHCGSRNFGNKVCRYWEKRASSGQIDHKLLKESIEDLKKKVKDRKDLPKEIEKLKEEFKSRVSSNGYLTGENMKGYITDMIIAQAYAKYNHKLICNKILEIMRKINNAKVVDTIQSIHNYIDISGDRMIRKGAIRSYKGERMVIPFNMRDGLAICEGKSNEDWNCSAPHGAGRIMSRSKAKQEIDLEKFKESMEGIYTTSVCKNTIDESPMAYKDMDIILEHIKKTCNVLWMIKPVINIKSTDEGE